MSAEPASTPPNVTASAGPLLLGYLFNWGLYGVLSVQVYMYTQAFPKDKISRKALVFTVYALETLQTAIVAHDAFVTYAAGFGDVTALLHVHLLWLGIPVLSGIVSATVQMYYAFQISVLWKAKFPIMPCLIIAIALMQGSGAIATGVQARKINDLSKLQHGTFAATSVWLAGSTTCDILIALSMTFALTRFDTSFKKTHDLVNKLIRLTVETGALTATIAVIDLILFLAASNTDYHITPALLLAKLYSNTLLVVLNSRITISHAGNDSHIGSSSWNASVSPGNRPKMAFASPPRGVDHRLESIELGGIGNSNGPMHMPKAGLTNDIDEWDTPMRS